MIKFSSSKRRKKMRELDDFLKIKPLFAPYTGQIKEILSGNFSLLREDLKYFIKKSLLEKTSLEEKKLEKLERYFLRYFSKQTSA